MVFKETFTTNKESEIEIQKFLTYLEEHKYHSQRLIDLENYSEAYAEEVGIERNLLFLNFFLKNQTDESKNELKIFKKSIASESLKIKCKQIDKWVSSEFRTEGDEDFGEED
jgi:hypothetical protein